MMFQLYINLDSLMTSDLIGVLLSSTTAQKL